MIAYTVPPTSTFTTAIQLGSGQSVHPISEHIHQEPIRWVAQHSATLSVQDANGNLIYSQRHVRHRAYSFHLRVRICLITMRVSRTRGRDTSLAPHICCNPLRSLNGPPMVVPSRRVGMRIQWVICIEGRPRASPLPSADPLVCTFKFECFRSRSLSPF